MAIALTRTAVAGAAVSAVLCGCMLAGCASLPKTPEEYRSQAISGGDVENIEVNRPFREVAATFRDRASTCLQDLVTTTITGPVSRRMMTKWFYHPTVLVTDRKAELSVQMATTQRPLFGDPPENGFYVIVAQAVPIDSRRTRVTVYGSSVFYDKLYAAVKGWATGAITACPDMS